MFELTFHIGENTRMNIAKKVVFTLLLGLITQNISSAAEPNETTHPQTGWYLFTSFRDNGQDGLHLALSRDGYTWTVLNNDKSFLQSTVGAKIMRDPSIAQGPDGTFHLVNKVVYAHAGEPELIRLRCDRKALRYCLERFGIDITIIPLGDGSAFEAVFKAPPEGILYWALQQMQSVEVLAPASLREKYKA